MDESNYYSFLLRCWQEPEPAARAGAVWRFSLEDPTTGARQAFADFERLTRFLQARLTTSHSSDRHGVPDPP